nr:hypothetical protein [Tanacetum cinerariifolium]
MDYFKGMSYDDIRPIFEAKFNSNVAFLLKTKEHIEEDENRALQRLNETPTERATIRQKLDDEVEELKRHLQIVPNEDDDVYTEATPLAREVPVIDYQIIEMNNKPYYKIIRTDDTHQLYSNVRKARHTFSDLEDSEKCTWSNKGQRMEAIRIMWCADHNIYVYPTDFVGKEEGMMNEEDMFGVNDLDGDEVAVDVSAGEKVDQSIKVIEKGAKPMAITTAATTVTIVGIRPKEKEIVMQEPSETPSPKPIDSSQQPSKTKYNGKAKMTKPEKPLKRKDKVMIDEEVARNLEAQMHAKLEEEEERLARQKEEKDNIALIES